MDIGHNDERKLFFKKRNTKSLGEAFPSKNMQVGWEASLLIINFLSLTFQFRFRSNN